MDIYATVVNECIHVNTCKRALPGSECRSVCFSRFGLNEAEWNTCFAWNAIESKGPLIVLPHHFISPTLSFSLSFPPCTCSTPTPPHFNLSLKRWTNSPSKVFSSMSLSSQITQVTTPLLQHSSLHAGFILLLYLLYVFYHPFFHPYNKHCVQCSVLSGDHWFS